jgi:GNAT superfamily N-acetyltransferase
MNYYSKYLKYKNKYFELKASFNNIGGAPIDMSLYEIKYVHSSNPECGKYLEKANELMRSCFGRDTFKSLPSTMPGIVVCVRRDNDELMGLLYIEDKFNGNRSLLWHGGKSINPDSHFQYNYFEIRGLCIRDKNRSEGFGSLLLNFAKKLGSDNGFDYMFATIDLDEDKDRRIKFYKKNNFYKQIPSLTDYNESPPLDHKEQGSVRYVSYISDKDGRKDIFGNRYKTALSQKGTDDYTNGPEPPAPPPPPRFVSLVCPYKDGSWPVDYCEKSKILSAEDAKLIEQLKNSRENKGERVIPFIDDFIKQCNEPDDSEIRDLINLVGKLAGAYKELEKLPELKLKKLPEHHEASFRQQLDRIGENMRDMIIALVPIPRSCRHEFPYCDQCVSTLLRMCSYCPDNIGVDQRKRRWRQLVRKCDAGYLLKRMKSHQNGSNRVAARANRLDYTEEDTAAGLFDE